MKLIGRFPLTISFIVALIFASIITPLTFTVFNANTYKTIINDSNIYTDATDLLTDALATKLESEIDNSLTKQLKKNVVIDESLKNKFKAIVQKAFDRILTEDLIKKTTENNIDNIFNYINGKDEELYLFIPKTELLDRIKAEVPPLAKEVKTEFQSFKTCSPAQLQKFSNTKGTVRIDCVPADFKKSFSNKGFAIFENVDKLIAELEKKDGNNILKLEDKVTAKAFLEALEKSDNSKTDREKSFDSIDNVVSKTSTAKSGLIGMWLGIAFLGLLILLLANGNFVKRLRAPFWPVLITEIAVIAFIVIGRSVLQNRFLTFEKLRELIDAREITDDLLYKFELIINNILNAFTTPIITFAGVLLMISVVVIAVSNFLGKSAKSEKVEEVKSKVDKSDIEKAI